MSPHSQNPSAAVLCLHSSMSHGGQWRALAARLEQDFRVITPDLLGYSADAKVFGGKLRLELEVAAVMQQIGPGNDPLHLVGHSFGGAVALRLACMYPQRMASLTLYEPVWFSLLFDKEGDSEEARKILRIRQALSSGTEFGNMHGARDFINYWAGGDGWSQIGPEQQRRLARLSSKVAAEFEALLAAGPATRELGRLSLPVRLLCGTRSPSSARRISELLATILPGVEYYRLPGLAHMAPLTHAEDVNPLIIDHIFANSADGSAAVA